MKHFITQRRCRTNEDELFFVKCQKCGDRVCADVNSMEAHSRTCLSAKCKQCGKFVGASMEEIEAHSSVCVRLPSRWSWFGWLREVWEKPFSSQPANNDGDARRTLFRSGNTNSSDLPQADHNDLRTVVIDNGSGVCKVGFAGNGSPSSVFPSLVGRPRLSGVKHEAHGKDCYVGKEVLDRFSEFSISYPIEHGIAIDWQGLAKLWHHAFYNELRVRPESCHVLLTEAPLSPKADREKISSIMFEQFGVQGVYISMHAVLSLYASGCTSGLFLDSGDGVSHAVPIFEGFVIPQAITRANFAGRDLTAYLCYILHERGHSLTAPCELESVRLAKQVLCYVALDFEKALHEAETRDKRRKTSSETSDKEATFKLPDGTITALGSERFRCPEVLFQPHLMGKELPGLQDLVCQSIGECDVGVRKQLFSNIVLSGGSTLFPSFDKRLEQEIKCLCPVAMQNTVKVHAPLNRTCSVWKGGSILASLVAFQANWISRKDYLAEGPSVVHRCSRSWSITETRASSK